MRNENGSALGLLALCQTCSLHRGQGLSVTNQYHCLLHERPGTLKEEIQLSEHNKITKHEKGVCKFVAFLSLSIICTM